MSQTSHLAHHPFGAAVARSPHPASGGGGEGWPIPLVGQSERGAPIGVGLLQAWMALVKGSHRHSQMCLSREQAHPYATRFDD